MASTYEPIATTTASGSVSSITFSSISGSYTDLVLIFDGKTSTASEWGLRFNSDSGNNYSSTWVAGSSGVAQSSRYSNTNFATLSYIRTDKTMSIAHIQNYSNTTTYKTVLARTSETGGVWGLVSLWRNTSAINEITVVNTGSYNFSNISTITLYGIKAA